MFIGKRYSCLQSKKSTTSMQRRERKSKRSRRFVCFDIGPVEKGFSKRYRVKGDALKVKRAVFMVE